MIAGIGNHNKAFIILWIAAYLLAGCMTGSTSPLSTGAPTKTVRPTRTIRSTLTPRPTRTHRPTATITVTPTVTKTPTFQPIIRTRVTNLDRDQASSLAFELMKTNGGCRLPCWWGLTPVQTDWHEAEAFLASMVVEFYIIENKDYTYAEVIIPMPMPTFENGNSRQVYHIV
ncbi:MAG TPA: hypothetical protein VLS48_06360, partial [Anaerolineales bacterium]|nr:hypothetical protein [Anaerolineales bacterium]